VPEALIQAGRSGLMGDVYDCLIRYPPRTEAIEARRRKANQAAKKEDDHYHTIANPAQGEKPGERGASSVKSTGYGSGRNSHQRRQEKRKKKPGQ
jgi:hypothetical protein